jgi:hypothetical protein
LQPYRQILLKHIIQSICKKQYWLLIVTFFLTTFVFAQSDNQITIYPVPLMNTYLPNPGMGWQHAPGIGEPLLPETVSYPQRSDISWQILNPQEGIYEWEILDEMIATAEEEGKQFSFRVYTMRGEDFGGHQVPEWVIAAGAEINPVGEPDYSNCTYQTEWARFVQALQERYDGHPVIAFIDISGYGDFNEWSWRDEQTIWDDVWGEAYSEGTATPETMDTLDSQTRRRLADMFIGGSLSGHTCRTNLTTGETLTVDYDYAGFQQTQLVMPFAGIRQSTQYVFVQRPDVGFRYDCLGRAESDLSIIEGLGEELNVIWRNAPVIFEICGYLDDDFLQPAHALLQLAHGSIVHDNLEDEDYRNEQAIGILMRFVGYRYNLIEATYTSRLAADELLDVQMVWQNMGYAPAYKRMGQDFQLRVYLLDASGETAATFEIEEDLAQWMPSDPIGEPPPQYSVELQLPVAELPAEVYQLQVAIINRRTNEPIRIAVVGQANTGRFTLGAIEIE